MASWCGESRAAHARNYVPCARVRRAAVCCRHLGGKPDRIVGPGCCRSGSSDSKPRARSTKPWNSANVVWAVHPSSCTGAGDTEGHRTLIRRAGEAIRRAYLHERAGVLRLGIRDTAVGFAFCRFLGVQKILRRFSTGKSCGFRRLESSTCARPALAR